MSVRGDTREYAQEVGGDTAGLGRWTWTKLEGRDTIKTIAIQVYRPVLNKKDNGSTYNQQRARTEGDPLSQFDEDMAQMIQGWKEEG